MHLSDNLFFQHFAKNELGAEFVQFPLRNFSLKNPQIFTEICIFKKCSLNLVVFLQKYKSTKGTDRSLIEHNLIEDLVCHTTLFSVISEDEDWSNTKLYRKVLP